MPMYSDDGLTTVAPIILTWSGWGPDARRKATRLLSGDYGTETVGNASYTSEVTVVFRPTEKALKDSFVSRAYEDGLFQLATREGTWHVEVLDKIEAGRWLPEDYGSTREWYSVTLSLIRRAAASL